MSRHPVLRVVPGGLADMPVSAAGTPDLARLAQVIVQAAQNWAAAMLEHGIVEEIDLSTDAGKVTLVLLDSVMQLEYWTATPVTVSEQEQGPATLW